jgi:hypothetical protein
MLVSKIPAQCRSLHPIVLSSTFYQFSARVAPESGRLVSWRSWLCVLTLMKVLCRYRLFRQTEVSFGECMDSTYHLLWWIVSVHT